jgi:hypothetical protein
MVDEVTAQVSDTGLSNPLLPCTLIVAVADPPGSTPAEGENGEGESVKVGVCPNAAGTWAAINKAATAAKMNIRNTGLQLAMRG